ncbi:MAG: cyclodeaminase/cyclohydrolase family protein [Bacteroidota bacterium]
MDAKLLDITTKELLEKFGAGNHKPGSGSAAAFQGMIAAKLLVTVISLTNKKKRRSNYSEVLPELLRMDKEIQDRIFPELTRLFHKDSIQFDKTIKLRKDRDEEDDLYKKNQLSRQALTELKIAVDIPLDIASLNIELADIAEYVFDNAFQSARGDSHVALSGAISGLAGCLSIIQLNLLSFGNDEAIWMKQIISATNNLKAIYQDLHSKANSKIEVLEKEVTENVKLHNDVNELLKEVKLKPKLSNQDIESYASRFQRLIWKHRKTIWKKNVPTEYIDILKPARVFKKALGYEFFSNVNFNDSNEIAGLIDQPNKLVLISKDFAGPTKNFTAAHELGHAILHDQDVLHRDRPIDGSTTSKRNKTEFQADKFATFFLMPGELVRRIFKELFKTAKFKLTDDTAFYLSNGTKSPSELRKECKDLNGLAVKLALTDYYLDAPIPTISELFNVSIGAMAIRLIELDLLEF